MKSQEITLNRSIVKKCLYDVTDTNQEKLISKVANLKENEYKAILSSIYLKFENQDNTTSLIRTLLINTFIAVMQKDLIQKINNTIKIDTKEYGIINNKKAYRTIASISVKSKYNSKELNQRMRLGMKSHTYYNSL